MALRKAQGQRGKYLTRELSSTRNPVEDMCAIVSKFQSAKIGVNAQRGARGDFFFLGEDRAARVRELIEVIPICGILRLP